MFREWILRFKRWGLDRRFWRDLFDLNADETMARAGEVDRAEELLDEHRSERLLHKAQALDVETPASTEYAMWRTSSLAWKMQYLSPSGRAYLRRQIDEEKMRRRQVKLWWVTHIIIPLGTLVVGILGALTGLIAILHHR